MVADACTDETATIAREYGEVLVIDAADKGTAMAVGVKMVTYDEVVFCDADLTGLLPGHIDGLCSLPPLDGQLVGIRSDVPALLGAVLPSLSGERRVPTWLALEAHLEGSGFEAETVLNAIVASYRLPWRHVRLIGVGNPTKITRHPLDWALEMIRVAFSSLVHLPSLVRYMVDGTSRHS